MLRKSDTYKLVRALWAQALEMLAPLRSELGAGEPTAERINEAAREIAAVLLATLDALEIPTRQGAPYVLDQIGQLFVGLEIEPHLRTLLGRIQHLIDEEPIA